MWSSGDPLTVHCKRAAIPCFHVILGSIFLTKVGGSESFQFNDTKIFIKRKTDKKDRKGNVKDQQDSSARC